jgi:hypothetical protein
VIINNKNFATKRRIYALGRMALRFCFVKEEMLCRLEFTPWDSCS